MKRISTVIFLILLLGGSLQARNLFDKGPLNAYTYLLVPADAAQNNVLLAKGIRAFYVGDNRNLEVLLRDCLRFNARKEHVFVVVLNSHFHPSGDIIQKTRMASQVFEASALPLPTEKALKDSGKYFVFLHENNNLANKSSVLTLSRIVSSDQTVAGNAGNFFLWEPVDTTAFSSRLLKFWNTNAHPVNFIKTTAAIATKLQPSTDALNRKNRISGVFMLQDKECSGIDLPEYKLHLRRTHFCLPFENFISLTPAKDGYFFSPSPITSNYSMVYKYFKIQVHQQAEGYMRLLKMNFDTPDSLNSVYNFISENVSAYKKAGLKAGWFNGNTSQITFLPQLQPDSLLNFSATFRLRLSSTERFQSVISQGKQFCFKISDGHPCFNVFVNTPYIIQSCKVDTGVWYHMAFVVSKGKNLRFYQNGKLVSSLTIEKLKPSNEILQIGNNSQFEPFKGLLDDVCIWNRALSDEEIKSQSIPSEISRSHAWLLLLLLGVITVAFIAFYILRHRRGPKPLQALKKEVETQSNALFFFGNFRLYNREGCDLAREMSPKLRLLFMIIAFETFETGKGISTKALTDLLWPGMSDSNAKNSRSPYIHKLRNLLATVDGLELTFTDKHWKLEVSEPLFCDYTNFIHLSQSLLEQIKTPNATISADEVQHFSRMVSGNLLLHEEHEFLDALRSRLTDKVLQTVGALADHPSIHSQAVILLDLAELLFKLDELSEEALALRVNGYKLQNNQSMVRLSMENFSKKYQKAYNEPYKMDNLS